jgi:cell division GTPase FtsZ
VLLKATKGISDLVTVPGLVNLDFADVKSIMASQGNALMGTGRATGPNRAAEAAHMAVSSPLLEDISSRARRACCSTSRRPRPHAARGQRGLECRHGSGRAKKRT